MPGYYFHKFHQPGLNSTKCAVQAALNYEEILSGEPAIAQKADYTLAQHIMQTEREAVLCQSFHRAAVSSSAGGSFRQPLVLGVVGEAHIEGIAELWEHDRWQSIVGKGSKGKELLKVLHTSCSRHASVVAMAHR